EKAAGPRGPGVVQVRLDQAPQLPFVVPELLRAPVEPVELDEVLIAAARELVVRVPDEGDPAAHPGGEVAARGAEDHRMAPGHVFAAMLAHPLDDGVRPRVADAEPLPREAMEEGLPGGGPVERHISDDHVLLRHEGGFARRADDDPASGEPLPDVVVRVAFEVDAD